MKRIIALLCSLLLLCGCAQEEYVPCVYCGEEIANGLYLDNGDTICGECFNKEGYLVCQNCRDLYIPFDGYTSNFGYCEDCKEKFVGICWNCDGAYLIEQMGTTDNGEHYICPVCENQELIEIINNPTLVKFAGDYSEAYDEAYSEGFDEGYDSGYEDGTEEGYKTGNDAGTKTGHDAGYEEGYKVGHEDGRQEGYNSGYEAGVKVASSVASSSGNTKSSNNAKPSSSSSNSSKPQSTTVYITKTGSKYHRSGCQYLSKSKISISSDDAKARGYSACSRCW